MPLINCPETGCNNMVSDQAEKCPKCGSPVKKAEYTYVYASDERGFNALERHIAEGWRIVEQHEEDRYNADDGAYTTMVYRLKR